jgi:cell division septation protein DedD
MRGKVLFVAGLAVGYVLGTRAGRRRFEQIKSAAQGIWESQPVQWGVQQAQEAVGEVAEEALGAAKRLIHQVTAEKKPAAAQKPAAAKPAAKPTARKSAATKAAAPKPAPAPAAPTETAE